MSTRRGNEETVEENGALIRVPLVLEPVAVPVPLRAIPVDARHVDVAVLVAERRCVAPSMSLSARMPVCTIA